jgi:adenylate cyclase
MSGLTKHEGNEGLWHTVFADGHPVLAGKQKRYTMLPGAPRCRLCHAPFGGVGGWVMRMRGLRASERNPNYCNACDGFLDAFPGGAEVPMSMMMVDIRNSVHLSANTSPTNFAKLVTAMRGDMLEILARTDGFVLEYQGDSVFAVWPPGFIGNNHAEKALEAAELAARLASSPGHLTAGVGMAVHTGNIFIGTVSAPGGRMQGIGAFGLDVNLLARLTHAARAGEVLVSTATFKAAGRPVPVEKIRTEVLKGIDHPVDAVVLGGPTAALAQ